MNKFCSCVDDVFQFEFSCFPSFSISIGQAFSCRNRRFTLISVFHQDSWSNLQKAFELTKFSREVIRMNLVPKTKNEKIWLWSLLSMHSCALIIVTQTFFLLFIKTNLRASIKMNGINFNFKFLFCFVLFRVSHSSPATPCIIKKNNFECICAFVRR